MYVYGQKYQEHFNYTQLDSDALASSLMISICKADGCHFGDFSFIFFRRPSGSPPVGFMFFAFNQNLWGFLFLTG